MGTAAKEEPSRTIYEVWDKARRCVVACFTSREAASAFIEPDGFYESYEIREYSQR